MHFISVKRRDILRKSLIYRHGTVAGSFYHVILTEKKDALLATFVLLPARSTALRFRQPVTVTEEDMRSFSELIFQDVFFAVFAKRLVLRMLSS